MATILTTFCVMSCLISGIYGCIIYYYFRNAKRMIWFAALCFSIGININFSLAYKSELMYIGDYSNSFYCNVFLATLGLSILCMNVYTGLWMPSKYAKIHAVVNYMLFLISMVSLVLPPSLCIIFYAVLFVLNTLVYCFSFYVSILNFVQGKRYCIYQAIAYGLGVLVCILTLVFALLNLDYYNPRLLYMPVFILFHGIMMTRRHSISREKTLRLSNSLADTIERIRHSDNALMCTQMKADFLYRSLDLISLKCDEDPFVAEDLTVSLSKYLRHTLNFQQLKGIVPLSNEIELTKSFISIEKERNPKVTFEYKFPDPIPDFHIPPLSIQPLVENAINHAFKEDQENPKITITIIPYRDYYHIDVSDNGSGMDEETVRDLTETLHESARIGIYNIHTRLISLFGKGLVIQSAPGVGSSVSFVVPPDAIAYLKAKEEKEAKE